MKVIELAEKANSNETMPKHIRYSDEDLYYDGYSYYDKEGNNDILDILAMNNRSLIHLFDEVEIIEDKKIPEKIDVEDDGNTITLYDNAEWTILNNVDVAICNKINEIIDYLEDKQC